MLARWLSTSRFLPQPLTCRLLVPLLCSASLLRVPVHGEGQDERVVALDSPSGGPLITRLKRYEIDLFSKQAIILAAVSTCAVLLATQFPLVPALIVCVLAALPYTISFWFGLVISQKPVRPRSLVWIALAWAVALGWWAGFANILSDHDLLEFTPENPAIDATALFFLWHLVDLIPLLDIDKTLLWDRPLKYKSAWEGSCVLLYQLLVVLPVIALVRRALRAASARR